jgi:VWFA-related protein
MAARSLLLLLCTFIASAQTPLRVDQNLVLVPVTVCDRANRALSGLEREHFRLFDNKVEQTVTHFWMDDEPLAVGLVFDTSSSMESKLLRAREAVAAFLQSSGDEDEFLLVEFNNRPELSVSLTRNAGEIGARLAIARTRGRTALLDAIYFGIAQIKKSSKARRALLVVSDGGDNASRYRPGELRRLVQESDVLIYSIGIYGPGAERSTPEEVGGPNLLADIAESTGGRHFTVDRLEDLPDIAAKIGMELRNRYILGFSPPVGQRDGRYHRLQIKLNPPRELPPLRAYWRAGYFAPNQ